MDEKKSIIFHTTLEQLSTHILLSSPEEDGFEQGWRDLLGQMRENVPCDRAVSLLDEVEELLSRGDVDGALSVLGGPMCEEDIPPRDTPESGLNDEDDDYGEIVSQFVSGTREHIERIEELALELEKGNRDVAREIKGRIHTIKGEAGALAYGDIEHLCHLLEDGLQDAAEPERFVEPILALVDWLHACMDAIESDVSLPQPSEIIEQFVEEQEGGPEPASENSSSDESAEETAEEPAAPAGQEPDSPQEEAPSMPAVPGDVAGSAKETEQVQEALPAPSAPEEPAAQEVPEPLPPLEPAAGPGGDGGNESPEDTGSSDTEEAGEVIPFEWGPDTVEMVPDFVAEATEGLSRVDEILIDAEVEGLTSESVNEMFRVFHSIKGVAGFLEIDEIQEFAHTTETLLNKARQGEIEIRGPYLDVIFDATAVMREIVDDLPRAIKESRRPAKSDNYVKTLKILNKAISEGLSMEDDVPPAEPGEKLGDILVKEGAADEEVIEKALKRQEYTDRPLGEELVKMGATPPKEVARALRAQKKAATQEHEGEEPAHKHTKTKLREMVKVDLDKIEQAMALIGELVIVESMVSGSSELEQFASITLKNHLNQLSKITRDLQDVSMSMRLVPIKGLFQKMARMVRDLSKKSGKQVRFVSEGETTEIDRKMVEQLSDPLVHMIRNAVDHGIEPPDVRQAAGKDPVGTVKLSAYHQGGQIIIEITDDGRGLDKEAIRAKALRQGLITEHQKLSDQEIYNLIFLPGFSTAKRVTEISGRGVGMDVVKRNIEGVRGKILIDSEPGRGTVFKIVLPLTTAIIDGMVVRCGTERYIVPTMSIIESLRPSPEMVTTVMGEHEIISVRGEILPLLRLGELLDVWEYETEPTRALVVVVETYSGRIGLMVDEVLQQQQIVIKNIDKQLSASRLFSGAAILSDGRVGLILNTEELATHVHR